MSTKPRVTVRECAELANQVYSDAGGVGSWRRYVVQTFQDEGFYACGYYKRDQQGGAMIVAVRGTQEKQDALDDSLMIPPTSGAQGRQAMVKLLVNYLRGRTSRGAVTNLSQFAHNAINNPSFKRYYTRWGNQIPTHQAEVGIGFMKTLLKKCEADGFQVVAIAGHSLGGALAQYLSQHTGKGGLIETSTEIPGVAFNAPFMGTIKGTRRGSGGGIMTVNCRLDPLSFMTRAVGNRSHATLGAHVIEPTPFTPLAPKLPDSPTVGELGSFVSWLLKAMRAYHSMPNLVAKLQTHAVGGILV